MYAIRSYYGPNDLLHWYAILDAQKNGFKYYDFGEVSKDNIGLARNNFV